MNVLYIVERTIDVGGSFEFNDIVSKTIAVGPGVTLTYGGLGARSLRLFATIRL
jgi:hypothetical protein